MTYGVYIANGCEHCGEISWKLLCDLCRWSV